MAITDPILLSPDVVLVPVADLAEEVRRKLDPEEGDWALTHPRARATSRLISARSAELLAEFKSPRTIVEGVIRYSQAHGLDPEGTLVEAYPLLQRLLGAGFLVAEGSDEAGGISSSLKAGDRLLGFEVLECIQALDDTELYQVRREDAGAAAVRVAALKIERPGAQGRAGDAFAREAAVLERLGGGIAPRLLGAGDLDGRRWLAIEWLPGIDAAKAAGELRRRRGRAGLPGLLALCRAVLAAYVRLHERGVLHADVHPRNVLVGPAGEVRLIDFGLSLAEGLPAAPVRGGVAFYFEPEYALGARAGKAPPAASAAGEQYAVAALLYLLLTGAATHDFKLSREEMLRQIAEDPPLPFALREAEPWPEVEALLARALAKDPGERFASLGDLERALGGVEPPPAPGPAAGPVAGSTAGPGAEALLARVLDRMAADGPLFRDGLPEPPLASVTYGAAGIACALYRIALAREDAALLSLADLWAMKAAAETGDEAFYRPGSALVPETLGRVTPYHTASGVHAVRAMIAQALGDPRSRREAVNAFLAASAAPCPNPDLTLGRSGLLLAACLLLEPADDPPPELRTLGDRLLAGLWEEIDELPPIAECAERPNLGMAHGWAGTLYASLRWCRAAGAPLPAGLPARLSELADLARPWGRGLRWRWYAESGGDFGAMAGWCNGSAGFVFLWTLAGRMLGDPRYLELAEGAAWNAWEDPVRDASLCCGLAGRAYALLNLHRHVGGPEWLERARDLAERAAVEIARNSESSHSLYKGEVGLAVLAADLAHPADAALPFFEEEGWTPAVPDPASA